MGKRQSSPEKDFRLLHVRLCTRRPNEDGIPVPLSCIVLKPVTFPFSVVKPP
jgi:hypothetical protein